MGIAAELDITTQSTGTDTSEQHGIGIHLDGEHLSVASAPLDDPDAAPIHHPFAKHEIPPAALVPAIEGEPVRLDCTWPPHPRGTAAAWPPEAWFDQRTCPGRYPLAFAWHAFGALPGISWRWKHRGHEREITPAEAIGAAVAAVAGATDSSAGEVPPVLIIPNHWGTTRQQDLLDACSHAGLSIRLLWRPVAAAFEWCERHRHLADGHTPGNGIGKLLVLHLGLDQFAASVLELIVGERNGERVLLPARQRPDSGLPAPGLVLPGFGFELAYEMAKRTLKRLNITPTPDELWRLLWTTPWISEMLKVLRGQPAEPDACNAIGVTLEAMRDLVWEWRDLFPRLSTNWPSHAADSANQLPAWGGLQLWRQWSKNVNQLAADRKLLGAIVTGPLAAVLQPDGRRFGEVRGREAAPHAARVLVEGSDELPNGVIARNAARYAARVARNEVTYFDTLPRLRTVVMRNGEPDWEPLLADEHQYVPGGKVWKRVPNLSGFAIKPGTTTLTLTIDHEEYPTVRELQADLSRVQVTSREGVSFAVSIEPAAGNARIEVVPEVPKLFGGRRVLVDIRDRGGTAVDTRKTPAEYLADLPRIFPGLLPRGSSAGKWWAAVPKIEEALAITTVGPRLVTALERVRTSLRQKDQNLMGDHTAVASDGTVAVGLQETPALLVQLVETLTARLDTRNVDVRMDIVRALAVTSTPDNDLQSYLLTEINRQRRAMMPDIDDAVLSAIGWCLRDERGIADFAVLLERRLRCSLNGCNNWLKAFSEVLRYRETAAREIPSEVCMSISSLALRVFVEQATAERLSFLFRNSALLIVYLLRRRAWDDDYMPPQSELAVMTKMAFEGVIRDIKARRLVPMGGIVSIPEQLKVMIDYIDRQGRGDFLDWASE